MLYKFVFQTYYSGVMSSQTYTSVEIYRNEVNPNMLITQGITIKSVKDKHHKFLGQKYAVRNALKNRPDLSKTIRSSIWKSFFERSKATVKLKGA